MTPPENAKPNVTKSGNVSIGENITDAFGVVFRPLKPGEIRQAGDYFSDPSTGRLYFELAQYFGTPQKSNPTPLEQSYRMVKTT